MRVNVHKQTFFSAVTYVFLLHHVKTRALLRMHRHFFSPFMCVFLLHCMETTLSMHTQTFFQSTRSIYLLHHMGKWKPSTMCIHRYFTVQHKIFWDTNMRS